MGDKVEFALLADFPEHAPRIARWYFDEWVSRVPGRAVDDVLAKILDSTSRSALPMMIIAKRGSKLIGAAELKVREMDIYPQFVHWLGGVYVDPLARGRGVGFALVSHVIERAVFQGIRTLHLQTEDLSGGLYNRLGFKPWKRPATAGVLSW